MTQTWANIGWTMGFALTGLVVMLVGLYIFDLLVPFALFKEVENGNHAVGWLVAGFLISVGIIMGTAFRQNSGLLQAVLDSGLGILLNYVGYFLWELFTPRWSLTDAMKKGSLAAGVVLFGLFIAIGLIIAGAAYPA